MTGGSGKQSYFFICLGLWVEGNLRVFDQICVYGSTYWPNIYIHIKGKTRQGWERRFRREISTPISLYQNVLKIVFLQLFPYTSIVPQSYLQIKSSCFKLTRAWQRRCSSVSPLRRLTFPTDVPFPNLFRATQLHRLQLPSKAPICTAVWDITGCARLYKAI